VEVLLELGVLARYSNMKTSTESRRRNRLALVVHCIWTTEDRRPLITTDIEPAIYATIKAEVVKAGCDLLALGGVADHVHLLVNLPSTLSIAKLMNQVKGVSSSVARSQLGPSRFFTWASHYAAFSINPDHAPKVIAYIERQKEHHSSASSSAEEDEP
jgi:putative transposase